MPLQMDTLALPRWCNSCVVFCVIILCVWLQISASETRIFTAGQWDGTGEENEYYYASNRNIIHDNPKYLVLASNIVRPGQVYRVCVSILETGSPVVVRASLHRDGEQVVSATEIVDPHQVTTLLMQVSNNPYS
ncbi:uncharacterized protein TNCT_116221 [Trichonephila clavata]|uniref:Uncharacterized protein n=1 Tax=Trichonephila clavata TaxID=2740835 RepID=A0A8X6J211_TRICU|nr:uncharacterized protein TNCT_116221 [Trichonephila clavata]